MPTYDNFKQDFKNKKSVLKPKKKINDGDMGSSAFERVPALQNQNEILHWEKYLFDLNARVKMQRETIKKHDQKMDKQRQKLFEQELEMRIMHRVKQRIMIKMQRDMWNNTIPKTQRLYQRVQEEER